MLCDVMLCCDMSCCGAPWRGALLCCVSFWIRDDVLGCGSGVAWRDVVRWWARVAWCVVWRVACGVLCIAACNVASRRGATHRVVPRSEMARRVVARCVVMRFDATWFDATWRAVLGCALLH